MTFDVTTDYDLLRAIADNDADVLIKKDQEYGGSWYRRGGVGAYMMLFRKIDRIETQCEKALEGLDKFDIIERAIADGRDEGLLDDIADLRRYLLLVEEKIRSEITKRLPQKAEDDIPFPPDPPSLGCRIILVDPRDGVNHPSPFGWTDRDEDDV